MPASNLSTFPLVRRGRCLLLGVVSVACLLLSPLASLRADDWQIIKVENRDYLSHRQHRAVLLLAGSIPGMRKTISSSGIAASGWSFAATPGKFTSTGSSSGFRSRCSFRTGKFSSRASISPKPSSRLAADDDRQLAALPHGGPRRGARRPGPRRTQPRRARRRNTRSMLSGT